MASLDLVPVTDHVSFVDAPTAIGIVRNGERAALVDTGLDENLVRKVLNHLADEGVEVEAIVNTHSHADHIGGNAFAIERASCTVHAPAGEHAFVEQPELEPWTLWGAPAPNALRGKFLQAQPSPVDQPLAEGSREIVGLEWSFHSLPGHSADQLAVGIDDVLFLGDALLPSRILDKYGMPFATDPLAQRESALRVPKLGYGNVQLYHGGLADSAKELAEANARAIDEARERTLDAVDGKRTAEEIFSEVATGYGWKLSVEQHTLNFATVRAHLAALERDGEIRPEVDATRLLWKRT